MPEEHHFRPGFGLIVAAFGADAEHARLAGQIRSALPPLVEFIAPIPYTGLQRIIDESTPWGILAYQKALYLDALSPEVISIITAQMPRKQSPMSQLLAIPMGGAFCQVPDEATAFSGSRAPCVVVAAAAFAPEPGLLAADRDWARQLWTGLLPYSQGPGSYVNLMADYDADRVRASYGPAKYAARPGQGRLRPRQRLPPQRQHQPRRIRRSRGSAGPPCRPPGSPGSRGTAARPVPGRRHPQRRRSPQATPAT